MSAPRVLVVDDIEASIVALVPVLAPLDCEVVHAFSDKDAILLALEREFAVILLGVQTPDMDGFEIARLVRESPRSQTTPIVFVTARTDMPASPFTGHESGPIDVLFKPLDPHVLASKVSVFLELHRARKCLADEEAAHGRTLAELDGFTYSVSHDLRAPLRHLTGFASILSEDHGAQLDEEGNRLLGRIGSAATHVDHLINDLLRLAKVGRKRPWRRPCDLAVVAHQVLADLAQAEPTRSVEIVCPHELRVDADEELLRIVLDNVIGNAWKFTSKRDAARIEVGRTERDAEPVYFVRDNGAGFDPAYAHKLFTPFQRLHTKAEFAGSGIGLAIVQRIVHRHHGEVWTEAVPDQGATFFFTLGDERPTTQSQRLRLK